MTLRDIEPNTLCQSRQKYKSEMDKWTVCVGSDVNDWNFGAKWNGHVNRWSLASMIEILARKLHVEGKPQLTRAPAATIQTKIYFLSFTRLRELHYGKFTSPNFLL